MLALGLKAPFLAISEQESLALAEGVRDVSEQFDTPVNPKVLSIINLFGAACAVYVPRAVMVWAMSKATKAGPKMNTADNAPGPQSGAAAGTASASAVREATPGNPGVIKFD